MRLSDLNPRWCNSRNAQPGSHQGLTFDCPHCLSRRLGAWFDVPIGGGPPIDIEAFQEAQRDFGHPDHQPELFEAHLGIKHWHREGDSFNDLTLTPSIDGSKFGCWHGHITNGDAV